MRMRKLLGLALAGAVAAAAAKRFRGRAKEKQKRTEVSPIDKEVPGDEPIDERDVPEDHGG